MKMILIIDDEPDVGETMKMIVERAGYKAEYMNDPVKALGAMKKFDLVLLDIMMPKMSGRQVLSEMKKKKITTPVIVVSAVGMPMETSTEIANKYPGTSFVGKTEIATELVGEIKSKIGAP